jgi:sulfide:quinone oxidoreductase
MEARQITEHLLVSPQITVADVAEAAHQKIGSIINNRPDGEAPDQPTSAQIEAAAAELGLAYRYIPVVPGQFSDADIAAFASALAELNGPVLAFCRTGTRAISLWALSQSNDLATKEILDTAQEAGYDLTALEPRLLAAQQSATGMRS